jgi:hypothetical protein
MHHRCTRARSQEMEIAMGKEKAIISLILDDGIGPRTRVRKRLGNSRQIASASWLFQIVV